MAVPYEACDKPNERSEFKDPDIAITLTHCAYYAKGLSLDQIQQMMATLEELLPSTRDNKYLCVQAFPCTCFKCCAMFDPSHGGSFLS
jgi:hypothetical protein